VSAPAFLPLRVQSTYSLLEGALHPADIVRACVAAGYPAVALADRANLFGAMEFADSAMAAGVQPIHGVMLPLLRPDSGDGTAVKPLRLEDRLDSVVLLAQSKKGYANLVRLVSLSHLATTGAEPAHLTFAQLEGLTDGLIALTAGTEGALVRLLAQGQGAAARSYLARLDALFLGRLYLEVTRTDDALEAQSEEALLDLADETGLPLVATNPVRFAAPETYQAHDVLGCIAGGRYVHDDARPRLNPHLWLKSADAMAELFSDLPEALANTVVIAQRCAVKAPSRSAILPAFAPGASEADMLAERSADGLEERLALHVWTADDGDAAREAKAQPYRERLAFELGVINQMGFAGYFLIVSDFIQWAKREGIPVGPGRGSGAGSLVAWALKITDLDPLRLGLLFERFLNPERVSMPDFDIDFCETRREDVIRYVQEKYGRDHVAQIITFGKMKARAVLKDVGRALQMPYGQVDRLSKLVPNHPSNPMTLAQALEAVPELQQEKASDPDVARLMAIALQLEGLYRHASTHAAGVVIGDRPLDALVPLYRDPRSDMPVTQFDMKWVEKAGLVKFDFLGLKTLSVLQRAVDLLKDRGVILNLDTLPWDDAASYTLMARGNTVGVFQLESEGMRRTLAQVKPDKFEDIIALVALYRPGPMDNIPTYAKRKHGAEPVDSLHPSLDAILDETYGVIIYQEQVMQIAQVLAGYSLGEADLLRRAMGKKKKEEMDAQKARFLEGAAAKGVEPMRADFIFELVAKFAGYGFNKSHAAAYALIAYQTAYLKANYPVEFYAASMAYDITNTDKLAVFVDDMKRNGVALLPPDINRSGADFTVEPLADGGHGVRYALAALKGVGEKAMDGLVAERQQGGAFRSFSDLAARVDPKSLNKKMMESLAGGGAFDSLTANRAAALSVCDSVLAHAAAAAERRTSAQVSLFGDDSAAGARVAILVPNTPAWSVTKRLEAEREAIGFYLSAHPLEAYAAVLAAQGVRRSADVLAEPPPAGGRMSVTLAGVPDDLMIRPGRDGGRFAMLGLSDASGAFRVGCFEEALVVRAKEAEQAGEAVLLRCELVWRPGEDAPRINAREIVPLAGLVDQVKVTLAVSLREPAALAGLASLLETRKGGRGEVVLTLYDDRLGAEVDVAIPGRFRIDGNVRAAVAGLPGIDAASLSG
jgi:DNA polymerase-3 subunit alpha